MQDQHQYNFNGLAGCVIQRKSRFTGMVYGLYHSAQSKMGDPVDGRWTLVCEKHGTCTQVETIRNAYYHLPAGDWCETCYTGVEDDDPIDSGIQSNRNSPKYQKQHNREKRLGKDTRRPLYESSGVQLCQVCNKPLSKGEKFAIRNFPAPICADDYDKLIAELNAESQEAEQERRERNSVGGW